jgi:inner membrane protein
MSPATHFLVGWLTAQATRPHEHRDRAIIALAGVAPDLDGLGIIPELLTRNSSHPLLWFSEYHHVLGHNLGFALVVGVVAFGFGQRRWHAALLAFVSFHLHLICDLLGARGPDGDQWPIPYLAPFSQAWQLTWAYQWKLNAWPNFVITLALLALAMWLAVRRGFSPVEVFSRKADREVVKVLGRWWPAKESAARV